MTLQGLKVHTELNIEEKVFTNLDFIKGTVVVSCAQKTGVHSIRVKLVGAVETKTRTLNKEKHFVVKESIQLCPAKGLSLEAGNTEFPFKFQFPLHAQCEGRSLKHKNVTLPPSFTASLEQSSANIYYYVKTIFESSGDEVIESSNKLKFQSFDAYEEVESMKVSSSSMNLRVLNEKKFGLKNLLGRNKTSLNTPFTVSMRSVNQCALDHNLPVEIVLSTPEKPKFKEGTFITIESLDLKLRETVELRVNKHKEFRNEEYTLSRMAGIDLDLSKLTKSDDSYKLTVPIPYQQLTSKGDASISPTFQSCNIQTYHSLNLHLSLNNQHGLLKPQKSIQISSPIKVLSGQDPPNYVHRKKSCVSSISTDSFEKVDQAIINKIEEKMKEHRLDTNFKQESLIRSTQTTVEMMYR